jgi:hypothetical protein
MTVAGPAPASAIAIEFGGSDDYLTTNQNVTISDSSEGIFSVWFKTSSVATQQAIFSVRKDTSAFTTSFLGVILQGGTDPELRVTGYNASGTIQFVLASTGLYLDDAPIVDEWVHLLVTWSVAGNVARAYLNDTLVAATTVPAAIGSNIANSEINIGAQLSTTIINDFTGCMYDMYINTAATLDMTTVSNRRKFITADLEPVDLGADGSTPTGSQPYLFLSGDAEEWETNKGSASLTFVATGDAVTDCADELADIVGEIMPLPEASINMNIFDGTDGMVRASDLSGNAASKVGIFSIWVRSANLGASNNYLLAGFPINTGVRFYLSSVGEVILQGRNSATSFVMRIESAAGVFAEDDAEHHILAAWDCATLTAQLWVDDVEIAATMTVVNDTIDYPSTSWRVSGDSTTVNLINARVGQLYFNNAEYVDIDNVFIRRRFISAAGLPVDMGSTGSGPTGTAPIVFLNGSAAAFATNAGTGGNFTIDGGDTIASGGTYP